MTTRLPVTTNTAHKAAYFHAKTTEWSQASSWDDSSIGCDFALQLLWADSEIVQCVKVLVLLVAVVVQDEAAPGVLLHHFCDPTAADDPWAAAVQLIGEFTNGKRG